MDIVRHREETTPCPLLGKEGSNNPLTPFSKGELGKIQLIVTSFSLHNLSVVPRWRG